ncbi:YwiC-like family protein [Ectobacillus ponti]|uniref:YwiC-like family protein n=1 Tax=Ectobacillus ponti TaxID=2961894 RepID=A0AA41X8K9_9BACI|nr:YwiC-like family protein [Ectobacillus ponti]MCP8970717.1 YwiC-like family protein [Ectobacillus ponti]
MKLLIPNQHGAWSMLVMPFLFGVIAGNPSWHHIALFFAWLFMYLGTYPFLMYLKQRRKKHFLHWAVFYMGAATPFGILALLHEWRIVYAALAMLPLFFVNMYFAKKKQERALLNDAAAILTFCIGGMMSYLFGTGYMDEAAWWILLSCFCFFMGSTFYVKTMIREKNSPAYRYVSWGYHLALTAGALFLSPYLALAFLPSLLRALFFYGKNMPALKVGVWEIANSVYFTLTLTVFMKSVS